MSSPVDMSATLELCLDCGCALIGGESRFCTKCEDEIRAEAARYDREPAAPAGGDVIDEEAVKAFLEQVNMDLNTLVSAARDIQRSLKNFAGEYELPYTAFRDDQRYNKTGPAGGAA